MDTFELRTQLTNLLVFLSPSKQSSQEICNFLLRNYVIQEDLYPAILDVLPKIDLNKRLNILQFIDDFLTLIIKDPKYNSNDIIYNYAFLILSDLQKILQYILPKQCDNSNEINNDLIKNNNNLPIGIKPPEIRTLSNLPFCYNLLIHISEIFKFSEINEYKEKFSSNLLTNYDKQDILNNVKFDEVPLYLNNLEPTKSSHVDDYLSNDNNTNLTEIEKNYIPEKINQGLKSAWEFLILKCKQSQYERLLINIQKDPFSEKELVDDKLLLNDLSPNFSNIKSNNLSTKTPALLNNNNNNNNSSSTHNNISNSNNEKDDITSGNPLILTHDMILQRIEADRERQKRGKESLWEVERSNNKIDLNEFKNIYNTSQSFNEIEDKPIIQELENLYKLCKSSNIKLNTNINNKRINNSSNSHQPYKYSRYNQSNTQYKQTANYSSHDYYNNDPSISKHHRANNNYSDRNGYDVYYGYDNDWEYGNTNKNSNSSNSSSNINNNRQRNKTNTSNSSSINPKNRLGNAGNHFNYRHDSYRKNR